MRSKKTRGHNRIWKQIDSWIKNGKELDLEHVKNYQRDYSKVWVRPYSNLSLGNSTTRVPKGKTRQKIIDGLFEIHANWKKQLDTLNEPYYLKIWFYHPNVSKSQVVCAIGDFISFYDATFYNPNKNKAFPFELRNLQWEHRIHEDHFNKEDFIGENDDWLSEKHFIDNKKAFEKLLKKPHRISKETYDDGVVKTYHSFKVCDVWLGSSN